VAAVAAVTVAALKFQAADSDADAALALQRCVCDVLAAQIDRLREFVDKGRGPQMTRDRSGGES
jgi:hypothetical protein